MATVIDRPLSALNNEQRESTVIPQRRRRDSIEIIDVDREQSWQRRGPAPRPASTSAHSSEPRPTTSRAQPIYVVESDSEDDIQIVNETRPRAPVREPRLFSPPPQPLDHQVPPVPPVPSRYSGLTNYLPLRRHPPPHPSPPIVRPIDQPFPFEYAAGPSNNPHHRAAPPNINHFNRGSTAPALRAQSQPRHIGEHAHHLPAIHFGGALISTHDNNRNSRPLTRRPRAGAARAGDNRRINLLAIGGFNHPWLDDDNDDVFTLQEFLNNVREEDDNGWGVPRRLPHYYYGGVGGEYHRMLSEHREAQQQAQQYQVSFTHPSEPKPGFTFHFAPQSVEPEDKSGSFFPKTSKDDPIVIDDDDNVSARAKGKGKETSNSTSSPATLTARLVCANCLDPLVLSGSLTPDEAKLKRVWGLRCGHLIDEKCLSKIGHPADEPTVDEKGKGKAKADTNEWNWDTHQNTELPEPEVNSYRSRLRPRTSSSNQTPIHLPPQMSPVSPLYKRRRTAATSRKTRQLVIEKTYEWNCPVPGCTRQHISVKVDGVWGPEKDKEGERPQARGAIPVFV